MADPVGIAYDVLLAAGVALLGLGVFWAHLTDLEAHLRTKGRASARWLSRFRRSEGSHVSFAAGWIVFGVFWFLHVWDYANQEDLLNALGAAVALPVFLFFAYHEWLSYKWKEDYEPLRFLGGAAFFASAIYFAFARLPTVAAGLIDLVADQTASAVNLLGYNFSAGFATCGGIPVSQGGLPVPACPSGEAITVGLYRGLPIGNPVVNIVLACTALQAYAVAGSLMLSTRDPWRRKALGLAVVLPITYAMNLVRNVVVIYFFGVRGDPFELVHNWYGKTLSLVVLLVLIFVAFKLLPELYVSINGLFELPWRKAPGHDYRKYIGRLSKKKEEVPEAPSPGSSPGAGTGGGRSGGAGRTPPSSP